MKHFTKCSTSVTRISRTTLLSRGYVPFVTDEHTEAQRLRNQPKAHSYQVEASWARTPDSTLEWRTMWGFVTKTGLQRSALLLFIGRKTRPRGPGYGKGPRRGNPGLTFHQLIPGGPQLRGGAAWELRGGGRGVRGACPREAAALAPAGHAGSCGPGPSWRAGPGAGREQGCRSRCGRRGGSGASREACGTRTGGRAAAGSCGGPSEVSAGGRGAGTGARGPWRGASASRPGPKPVPQLDTERMERAQPAASRAPGPLLGVFSLPASQKQPPGR